MTQAAIVLVSASMLMLEMLKTITLSLQQFHQTVFMVVSLALLGLGAGGSLATWLTRHPAFDASRRLPDVTIAFGASIVVAEALTTRLDTLAPLIFASTIPFLFAGLFLAGVFTAAPGRLSTLYFSNLIGSALGCMGLLALLNLLGQAGSIVLVCAALAMLAAAALAADRARLVVGLAGAAVCLALLPSQAALFPYRPNPQKHYGLALTQPGVQSTAEWSQWGFLGRLDAVVPGPGYESVFYDVSRYFVPYGCDFRYLFASGDNWSYTARCPPKPGGTPLDGVFAHAPHSLPYTTLRQHPDVLNIGLGGGVDIFLAVRHDARSVVGVEINPLMIEAARTRYGDYFAGAYNDPRVEIRELDGRTYVETAKRKFDLVTLTGVDTGAGLAAGANLLSENYLYTQEAFDGYLRVLKDEGVVYVYRPFPQLFRAVTTAVAALRRLGEPHPERNVFLFSDQDAGAVGAAWTGAVIARKAFSPAALQALNAGAGAHPQPFRVVYSPGLPSPQPEVAGFFGATASGTETAYYAKMPFDAAPVDDDRPYYYQQEHSLLSSAAGSLVLRILGWVTLGSLALVVLPILRRPSEGKGVVVPALLYFSALGAGFMFVEIGLIQKLALFLGHPAYSVAVTLPSMLLFSGLGSMAARRFFPDGGAPRALPFAVITACALGYALLLQPLLSRIQVESLGLRSLVVVVLLAPASFFQGMPFPMMLRRVGLASPPLVSWAYAVNSVASVIGSVLVVLFAMGSGFRVVLLLGAACYVVALLLAVRPLRSVGATAAPG